MYYIDNKYLKLISSRLPKFKAINDHVWICRCVICGDSKKNENKARGYFYKKDDSIAYKCHNCGISKSFYNFLLYIDPSLHKEYVFEYYKEKSNERVPDNEKKEDIIDKGTDIRSLLDILMCRLDTLNDDNIAVEYCLSRKIPRETFNRLYYIDDIRKIVQLNEKYKESLKYEEPRLFLPLYNKNGDLSGGTMRCLRGESRRYIKIKIKEDSDYIFGINHIDKSKTIYVVEGPIDSLFLDNCIAVGNSSLFNAKRIFDDSYDKVYVYDNQPNNKEICSLVRKQILNGDRVVIWPSNIKEKDINDIVLSGKDIKNIINSNIFSGLNARLKFNQWKRCDI